MKKFIRVMKALSDPGRVMILKMLGERALCVCEITALVGLAQPTVSKHMKILEDAGLVESWKEGTWVNYRLADAPDQQYAATMLGHLSGWLDDAPDVRAMLERLPKVDRESLSLLASGKQKKQVL